MTEYNQLGGATTERHGHLVLQFLARHQESVLCRTLNRIAERADAARDDRHLVNRVDTWQRKRHESMAHLVIGDDLPLLGVFRIDLDGNVTIVADVPSRPFG